MKLALVVGVDHYEVSPLNGCVNDAQEIAKVLSRNYDESPNFATKLIVSSKETITRPSLKEQIPTMGSTPLV